MESQCGRRDFCCMGKGGPDPNSQVLHTGSRTAGSEGVGEKPALHISVRWQREGKAL
jgi:hypothetical protein